ncbi:MAG: hypothetical protein LBD97_00640 [Bifidobacteriaceae bacterium]|jgi:hypothetical protein|nr:hypothetical protein [Bifidobacteriaceae bacterium]
MKTRSRTLKVVRLHLANRATYLWTPLLVVGATLFISLAMYGVLLLGFRDEGGPPGMYGFGGLQFIPTYYCVTVGIQAMMYTYQFAMAMSLTRREYINGTTLLAAGFAAALAAVFSLGRVLESLTGGYGISFRYFSLAGWFTDFPWWEQWVFLTGLSLVFFMAGFCGTTVFRRGGAIRLVVVLTLWVMVAVGMSAVVTWREWWPLIGRWALALTPASAGGWMLLVAACFSAGSYWSMRKTVP